MAAKDRCRAALEPANIARQAGLSTTVLTNCYYSDDDDKRRIRLKTLRTVAQKFNKPLGEIDPGGEPTAPADALAVAIELVEKVFAGVPETRLSAAQRAQAIREAQAVLTRHFPTKS